MDDKKRLLLREARDRLTAAMAGRFARNDVDYEESINREVRITLRLVLDILIEQDSGHAA